MSQRIEIMSLFYSYKQDNNLMKIYILTRIKLFLAAAD